jgi:hypothetical protein
MAPYENSNYRVAFDRLSLLDEATPEQRVIFLKASLDRLDISADVISVVRTRSGGVFVDFPLQSFPSLPNLDLPMTHRFFPQDNDKKTILSAEEQTARLWSLEKDTWAPDKEGSALYHRINTALLSDNPDELLLLCPLIRLLKKYIVAHSVKKRVAVYHAAAFPVETVPIRREVFKQPIFVSASEDIRVAMRKMKPSMSLPPSFPPLTLSHSPLQFRHSYH